MRNLTRRQKWVLGVAGFAVIAAGATGAYAFYSAANATAAPENSSGAIGDTEQLKPLVLSATVPAIKLGQTDYVTYHAKNENTTQPVHLSTVSAGTVTVDAAHSGCPAGSFTLTDFNSYGAQDIAPGDTVDVGAEVLHYNNLSMSQNACIGATLTVTFSTT